jgi:hypothetical protein
VKKRLIAQDDFKSWTEPRFLIPIMPYLPSITLSIAGLTAEHSAPAEILAAVVRAVDDLLKRWPQAVTQVRLEESQIAADTRAAARMAVVTTDRMLPPATIQRPVDGLPRASLPAQSALQPSPAPKLRCAKPDRTTRPRD